MLPTDGASVRLTLDTAIQTVAEDALEQLWRRHRPKGALILVLEPHTGDILAIANRPTFDLATRKGLTPPRNDTPAERDRAMEPLRNRAVEFLYEPGLPSSRWWWRRCWRKVRLAPRAATLVKARFA